MLECEFRRQNRGLAHIREILKQMYQGILVLVPFENRKLMIKRMTGIATR